MKQEQRKLGLRLGIVLGIGATSMAWNAGSQEESASFDARADFSIEDIQKVLAETPAGAVPVITAPVAGVEVETSLVGEALTAKEAGVDKLAEVPTIEEHVVRQAAKEFSGFEPLERVEKSMPTEMVSSEEGMADTVALAAKMQVVPSDRITVQLDKAGLEETINLFSQLSGVNIIIPGLNREGTVTVNLNDVDWKPALQSVLDAYNLELYQKVPSVEIYTIREKQPDAAEPLELRTFKLNYATVSEVEGLVQSMLAQGSTVSKFPSRNMISVRSTAAAIEEIDQLIAAVDVPRQQVFIEAKFLELSDSASESIGLDWAVLDGYSVGASSLSSSYSSSTTKSTGTGSSLSAPETYDTSDGSSALWLPSTANQAAISKVATSVLAADDFRLTLSALKALDGTKIVSNPKIIVANEETASIHIGDKIPNIKGTTTTYGDSQAVITYGLDDTEPYFTDGIMVNVTPTVNTESSISVQIEPTLDRLNSTPTTAADGTEFYGKTTKTISTVFSLQSGQTAAIGGLTEVSDVDVDRSIPVLGSIPLLGRLFSYSSTSKEQVETIIFVTVGLANPASMELETGLPEDASLVRRYRLMSASDRAVVREELRLLEIREDERVALQLEALRAAELQRISEKNLADPTVKVMMKSIQ